MDEERTEQILRELHNAPPDARIALLPMLKAVQAGASQEHLVREIMSCGLTNEDVEWLTDWLSRPARTGSVWVCLSATSPQPSSIIWSDSSK
jgi:hypothetical protein